MTSRVLRKRGFLNSAIRIIDSLCKSNLKDQKQFYYCSINYEYGKLLWALDKKDDAIVLLEGLFDDDLESVMENGDMAVFQAKIRLQSFKMRYEHGAFEIETLLSRLYESIQLWPNQEKIFCHFSRFLLSLVSDKEIEPENEWVIHAAKSLARGVLCGSKNVQETLPKLLSLWFQYGLVENTLFNKIHRIVFKLFEKATPQKLSLSLSQLISRICHPREEVFRLLSLIIFSILQSFPQSTLWQLVGVCRSTLPTRSKKCQEILGKCRNDSQLKNILSDMLSIRDSFVTLANLNTSASGLLISREIPSIKRLFPLSIAIPSPSCFKYEGSMELPKLVEISDRVDVMNSLQKPKRFTMIGSDGSYHCFLAKSKDDLRKDSRFIEYLGKVKDLLGSIGNDIRPYTVIPLDETCGIIEWVNDIVTYRSILLKIYEERGLSVSSKQLKEISALKLPAREIFLNHLLPKFPSVLNEWFFRQFIYPDTWLKSKLAFISTCGIMSVSGWVVGLGDRHGENLLLDSRLGRVVHVDFSCLFEKGLTLEKPERVPFRLTHNMENGMGPFHFLGLFERICRETLLVMRNNRKMVLHGLETFVFDPLVEWTGKASRGSMGEVDSVEARKILAIIDDKIQGLVGSGKSLKLSVQAQVDQLVKDATSVENLSVMYIGWAPFM